MQDTILSTAPPGPPHDSLSPAEDGTAAAAPFPGADGQGALDGRFSVPITVELESTAVPLAELQAIREGAVLPLDIDAGSIPVRILASGKPFANGTLISIGDGYGVLIEAE